MKFEYEFTTGKTIKKVEDASNSEYQKLRFIFTDGSFFEIQGSAWGHDVEYDGLYFHYFPPPPNGQCPHGHEDWDDCPDCGH